mgnify:CR=1 FL=1
MFGTLFMRHFALFIFAVAFLAVVGEAQDTKPIKPATTYRLGGASIITPDQPDWVLLKSDTVQIVIEKRTKDEVMNASIKTLKVKPFASELETQQGLEAFKNEEIDKPNRDSLHYMYVRFKGLSCVQYDGNLVLDPAASPNKFKHNNFKGYLCPDPQTKGSAFQIEFSNYSNTKGFPNTFNDLSEEFFQNTKFPKPAPK